MSTRYQSPLIPHAVVARMHPEDVALCYDQRIAAADIPVAKKGEKPAPNGLFLRLPDRTRKRARWYYNEVVGGKRRIISTGCDEDDLDGALAWALSRLAQRAVGAASRLAPESQSLCDVLADYLAIVKQKERAENIKAKTFEGYLHSLKLLALCFRDASIADIQAGGARKFLLWAEQHSYGHNTAVNANNLLKRAINAVMTDRGSAYRVAFHVGARKPKPKRPFDPDELARIDDRVWNGTIYGDDLRPTAQRCSTAALAASYPFRVAVPFMVDSGTRHQATCQVNLVDWRQPFLDLDEGVLHRRGLMTEDVPNKRRGSCLMSSRFMDFIRPIAAAALARGATHLITTADGHPLKNLDIHLWKQILADAKVPYRVLHCLKDTAVQIARVEGVPLYAAAERFATTPATLIAHYGADWDLKVQMDPAEVQGARHKWLRLHEALKTRAAVAAAARAAKVKRVQIPRGGRKRLPPRKPLALPPPAGAARDGGAAPPGD